MSIFRRDQAPSAGAPLIPGPHPTPPPGAPPPSPGPGPAATPYPAPWLPLSPADEGVSRADLTELAEAAAALRGDVNLDSCLQTTLDAGLRLGRTGKGFACLMGADGSVTRGVFRGLDKPAIGALLARSDVRRAAQGVEAVLSEGMDPATIALGLKTAQGTSGVLVFLLEELPAPGRTEVLRALTSVCSCALDAAEKDAGLEATNAELISIIGALPSPILLVDGGHELVGANPAAELLFGFSSSFSVGQRLQGRLGHEGVERMLLSTGRLVEEVVVGNPPKTFRARASDVIVGDTRVGRVLVMDDVTAAKQSTQTQRDFVSMVGHELRTPLTLVKGFARALLNKAEKGALTSEEARIALTTIDARAVQLERLIENLLHVSKIESREANLLIEDVHIRDLVQAAADDQVHEYGDRSVYMEVPEGLRWNCDGSKIGLVLRHLIENALKFSEPPAGIIVQAEERDDELLLEVIDRGLGILSTDMPHIFDRFHQVDSSSTRSHGGTGVGLYVCSLVVKLHGGRISADSTWGKGSTFSVFLPRRALQTPTAPMELQPGQSLWT